MQKPACGRPLLEQNCKSLRPESSESVLGDAAGQGARLLTMASHRCQEAALSSVEP